MGKSLDVARPYTGARWIGSPEDAGPVATIHHAFATIKSNRIKRVASQVSEAQQDRTYSYL
jgi:hypothetical protein